jgi:hypothetical protein
MLLIVGNHLLEELDELLIQHAHFVACKAAVLLEDARQAPLLHLPQTAYHTSCTMLNDERLGPLYK